MPTESYRQGDVLVERVAAPPPGLAELPPTARAGEAVHVLAEGEATGHAHRLAAGPSARLLAPPAGDDPPVTAYLDLRAPALLVHDEHPPVDLPFGTYRVVRQRRHDPWAEGDGWRLAGD